MRARTALVLPRCQSCISQTAAAPITADCCVDRVYSVPPQLQFLRTFGVPPLAPTDFLQRNGLLEDHYDEEDDSQMAETTTGIGRRSRAETSAASGFLGGSLSPSSSAAQSPRRRAMTTMATPGSPRSTASSERSYASSLAQSEAGQSAKWKKTLVSCYSRSLCPSLPTF